MNRHTIRVDGVYDNDNSGGDNHLSTTNCYYNYNIVLRGANMTLLESSTCVTTLSRIQYNYNMAYWVQ